MRVQQAIKSVCFNHPHVLNLGEDLSGSVILVIHAINKKKEASRAPSGCLIQCPRCGVRASKRENEYGHGMWPTYRL